MPWVTLKNGRKVFIFRRGNVNEFEKTSNEKPEERRTKWQTFEEEREKTARQIYGEKFDKLSANRQSNVEVFLARQHYRERTRKNPERPSVARLDKISERHYNKKFERLNKYQQDTVQIEELNTRR